MIENDCSITLEGRVGLRRTLWTAVKKMQPSLHHFDNVEQLGQFLEIEAPVKAGSDEISAKQQLDTLLSDLGFDWRDCIRASYLDLMLRRAHVEGTT
jgi:adenylate cyclase class IV